MNYIFRLVLIRWIKWYIWNFKFRSHWKFITWLSTSMYCIPFETNILDWFPFGTDNKDAIDKRMQIIVAKWARCKNVKIRHIMKKLPFLGQKLISQKQLPIWIYFDFESVCHFLVDYCNCSKVLDFTFSSRSDFWAKFTQKSINKPSLCLRLWTKLLFLSKNYVKSV